MIDLFRKKPVSYDLADHGLKKCLTAFDLTLLGFDPNELANLLLANNFAPGTEDDQGKLDELAPRMVTCPACSHEFDSREA